MGRLNLYIQQYKLNLFVLRALKHNNLDIKYNKPIYLTNNINK